MSKPILGRRKSFGEMERLNKRYEVFELGNAKQEVERFSQALQEKGHSKPEKGAITVLEDIQKFVRSSCVDVMMSEGHSREMAEIACGKRPRPPGMDGKIERV